MAEARTFEDVFKDATEEEVVPPPEDTPVTQDMVTGDSESKESLPDFVFIPDGFKIPAGKTLQFVKLHAKLTDTPHKGDRWVLCWRISDAEEKRASSRTRGDSNRTVTEFAKQMIRLIDGKKVDWSGTPAAGTVYIEQFWNDIGFAYRQQLQNIFLRTHALNTEQQLDFFANCLHVRTAVAG